MKKIILTQPRIMDPDRVDDYRRLLYLEMQKRFGFDLLVKDEVCEKDICGYDLVFVDPRKYLHKNIYEKTIGLLSTKAKIVVYLLDPELPVFGNREYDSELYLTGRDFFYDRADLIVGDVYQYFRDFYSNEWDKWKGKYIWWPKCIAKIERYRMLPFNKNPEPYCYLSGKIKNLFPLRKVAAEISKSKIATNRHPGYENNLSADYTGDNFGKILNRYLCCFCGSRIFGNVLEKHLIIPASGSLMLADSFPDLNKMGLLANTHYLEVESDSLETTIDEVVSLPEKYEEIRMAGRNYVLQNHTIEHRMETLGKAMNEYF